MNNRKDFKKDFKKDCCLIGVLWLLIFLVFLPGVNGEFVNWDDNRFVQNNPHVQTLSLDNLHWAFSSFRFESYQPFHMVSYMVDGLFWHGSAIGYKIHNLFLYLLAISLLYTLLRRLGVPSMASFIGTAVFAVAPYRVESFIWISARKDVLALFFSLLAWQLHLNAIGNRKTTVLYEGLSTLLLLAALLSKSSSLVIAPMMLCVDILWRKKQVASSSFRLLASLSISVAVAVFLPMLWQSENLIKIDVAQGPIARMGLSFWSIFHYAKTVMWPYSLSALYAQPSIELLHTCFYWGIGGLLVTATTGALWFRKRRSTLPNTQVLAGWFCVAIGVAPFINVIPMYYLVADRYLLFPSIGISLLTARFTMSTLSQCNMKARGIALSLFSVLIVSYTISSAHETYQWRTTETLFAHATVRQPNSFWAQMKYGESLRNKQDFTSSEAAYRNARRIRPLSPSALGGVFWAAFEQDQQRLGVKPSNGDKATNAFLGRVSNPAKLHGMRKRLIKFRCIRAANVVKERLLEM